MGYQQLSTIRIQVPNHDSIRSNTNSAFGPLFGPFELESNIQYRPTSHTPGPVQRVQHQKTVKDIQYDTVRPA